MAKSKERERERERVGGVPGRKEQSEKNGTRSVVFA